MSKQTRKFIPAVGIEFDEGGNTFWVQSPKGGTVLRIKCAGITVKECATSPLSHFDLSIPEKIEVCMSKDDLALEDFPEPA